MPWQYPNTPKVKPLKEPSDIDFMMGVERTAIRSRPNARNSTTDKGDAGRNMVAVDAAEEPAPGPRRTGRVSSQRRRDAAE